MESAMTVHTNVDEVTGGMEVFMVRCLAPVNDVMNGVPRLVRTEALVAIRVVLPPPVFFIPREEFFRADQNKF
jgi:hypothetical protein